MSQELNKNADSNHGIQIGFTKSPTRNSKQVVPSLSSDGQMNSCFTLLQWLMANFLSSSNTALVRRHVLSYLGTTASSGIVIRPSFHNILESFGVSIALRGLSFQLPVR
jgi:hypothetical protein